MWFSIATDAWTRCAPSPKPRPIWRGRARAGPRPRLPASRLPTPSMWTRRAPASRRPSARSRNSGPPPLFRPQTPAAAPAEPRPAPPGALRARWSLDAPGNEAECDKEGQGLRSLCPLVRPALLVFAPLDP
ncbi:protein of unknown function [Methylorubrum extorquens]|uniref:Uncharacterized protein n=1 Tax=Methylorubrum extorquens TaxID=408 RepID=A0A2N9ANL8_METEX|nr:protein of unknown function [Methylorubrum extorquens]